MKLYLRHGKMNYSDVQIVKPVGVVCRYFMRLSAKRCDALFYPYYSRSIANADAEKIKNLLAHCQYSGSSKIIHEAYDGYFSRASDDNFCNWNAARANRRQSCGWIGINGRSISSQHRY